MPSPRCRLPASGEATIADYGCSEGRNSMATIGSALELLAGRGVAGFGVLHNDLPTNDWLSLAKNLVQSRQLSGAFPAGAGLVRAARLLRARHAASKRHAWHIGLCRPLAVAAAAGSRHAALAVPLGCAASELAKILTQAAVDWQAFLEARAEELQPGGVLLVQMLGSDGSSNPVRVSAAGLVEADE